MKDGRLHMRIDKSLLRAVTDIATRKGCSLSSMVEQYFQALVNEEAAKNYPQSDEDLGVEQV